MAGSDSQTKPGGQPIRDEPFMFGHAFQLLRRKQDKPFVESLVLLVLVRITAKERGISVSETDLQQAADGFRRMLGLDGAADTYAYLEQGGLEIEDFEFLLESELLYHKLKQSLCRADDVQKMFAQNLQMFETLELAGLHFKSRDEAEGFYEDLIKGKKALTDPAAAEAESPSPEGVSVYLGHVSRADLADEAAARVFADDADEFVGPIESEASHWIYQILLPKRAELDENSYAVCEDLIVQEFFNQKLGEILNQITS